MSERAEEIRPDRRDVTCPEREHDISRSYHRQQLRHCGVKIAAINAPFPCDIAGNIPRVDRTRVWLTRGVPLIVGADVFFGAALDVAGWTTVVWSD